MIPVPDVHVTIEIDNSCNNCCDCLPFFKKKKEDKPQEPPKVDIKAQEVAKSILQVKKEPISSS